MTLKSPVTMRMPAVTGSVPAPAPPPSWPATGDAPPDHVTEPAISLPRPSVRDRANLTLLTGPSAGEIFPLIRLETVLGRDESADLTFDDAAISRRHARILREPTGEFHLEDLGSTNGTYVSAEAVTRRQLRTGEQIQLGPNLLFRFAVTDEAEERLQRQLFESSIRDPLTQAYNRKYLNERLAAEVAHARRHSTKLALLMLDLDDFKGTNDRHGHLAGDAVLRQVAATVVALIRIEDVFARFGGEEFVVLTRGDGVHNASQLGERLRRGIADAKVAFEGSTLGVTVSIGVADLDELPQPSEPQALIERADARLYLAKAQGRNRVTATDA
jgi:two-component system cell cycle response regulator